MAEEIVKLRLANGRIIERPRKVARIFIRGGAEEILPVAKPKEVLTKTTAKVPPPIILREPEITKPEEYPGESESVNEIIDEPVKEEIKEPIKSEVKETIIPEVKSDIKIDAKPEVKKAPAKKKSTKKAKK